MLQQTGPLYIMLQNAKVYEESKAMTAAETDALKVLQGMHCCVACVPAYPSCASKLALQNSYGPIPS